MVRLRSFVSVVGSVSVALSASGCSDDGGSRAGAGGAGDEGPMPTAGAGGDGAAASCPTDGSGTLLIEVEGLPEDVAPKVSLDGPTPATDGSAALSLDAGAYVAIAERVYDEDPIVRTVYAGRVESPSFCLRKGERHTLKVKYAPIPSSNKLWMPSGHDLELAGFSSIDIVETVAADASVAIDTLALGSIAFDRDGNLWGTHTIIGEDMLVRIPAAELGDSGTREPDIRIALPEIEAFPYINHIAFDPLGNLWLSSSGDQLRRLNPADLVESGEKISDVLFTAVVDNQGIAFDRAGNLWVAGGPTLVRFDAVRLDISDVDPPDLELKISAALGDTVLGVEELAFDKAGNLWGVAGSTVFQLAASDLEGTGTKDVKANVSFDVDVLAHPSTPAFDDADGLWVSLDDGAFGRYAPATLGRSAGSGRPVSPDVTIRSESVGANLPLAFFPAPQGLPLHHSLPGE